MNTRSQIHTFRLYPQIIPDHDDNDSDEELLFEESSAQSSPQSQSSPILASEDFQDPHILLSETDLMDESDDEDFFLVQTPKKRRKSPLSDIEKTRLVLQFMRNTLSRFSLHKFLSTIFSSSDGSIKNFTKIFLADGGHLELMEMWWNPREKRMADWAVQKTAYICSQEASHLTDRASEGPHFHDAQFLQVSSKHASVRILNHFRIHDLLDRYERTTPHIQVILKSIINKDKKDLKPGSRDVDSVSSNS